MGSSIFEEQGQLVIQKLLLLQIMYDILILWKIPVQVTMQHFKKAHSI